MINKCKCCAFKEVIKRDKRQKTLVNKKREALCVTYERENLTTDIRGD